MEKIAWQQAQWLLDGLDPATIEKAEAALAASESVGQQRLRSLHGARGSHQEVAHRLEEYHDLGIAEFILWGYPHVEQTYWFAEGVMRILRAKGIYGPRARERRLVRSA